jgi:hypothetical protein
MVCSPFALFAYICIAFGDPIIKKRQDWDRINQLNPFIFSHVCVYPKQGPRSSTP